MKTNKIFFLLSFFILFLSCNKGDNENPKSVEPNEIQKVISPADIFIGDYEIGNFKQKGKINISYENGEYILKEFNKKKNDFQKLTILNIINKEDLKSFVGLPIYNQLIEKTALYSDYKGGIAILKIKKGTEIHTMMSSGKSSSEYLLYFGDTTVKDIFKK
jgi:uncharacterized protein (DUF1919 family)